MGNLSAREKFMLLAIGLILVVFGLQMLVLKPQQNKTAELEAKRNELQAQKDYYDQMLAASAQDREQIEVLNEQISNLENSFLPALNSEAIQQYVLNAFESHGCPYLISINSEDITRPNVVLPDSSVSNNYVMIKRVNVTYSSTDGFCVPQYGDNPANTSESIITWLDRIKEVIESHEDLVEAAQENTTDTMLYMPIFGTENSPEIIGYNEFISTLMALESENPDCIKISSFNVTAEGGYLVLKASIDFYSANLVGRVSDPDLSPAYVTFAGRTPAHSVNQIGLPLYPITNPESAWAGVMLVNDDVLSAERPFATYYSSALFKYYLQSGTDLATLLGCVDTASYVDFDAEAEDVEVADPNADPGDEVA